MPLYICKLGVQDFPCDRAPPNEAANAWKVVAYCDDNRKEACFLFAQIGEIEAQFRMSAINGMLRLIEVAATGSPLSSFYDKKKCHEIGEFVHSGTEHRLYRIRTGDTRIVFGYGPSREIFVCAAIVKKADEFTKKELRRFEATAVIYLDAFAKGDVKYVEFRGEKR